ncbi:MAG: hypothetical protein RMH74_05630 [Candidatus Caldarchaeum sp.]|nr:hypothetical protein [Candidatus Caldarchaeum sp.]
MKSRKRADLLLEVLMSSVNLDKVPLDLGWSVWRLFSSGEIYSSKGVRILIKACRLCEPDKTKRVLRGEEV